MYGGQGFVHRLLAAGAHFIEVFGHQKASGMGQGLLVFGDSRGRQHVFDQFEVGRRNGLQVQVRRPAGVGGVALRVDLDELHATRGIPVV